MELILQNDLEHQQRPVMNVASVIETSNVSETTAPHRNPEIYRWSLNSKTIYDIWVKEDIPHKYRRFVYNPNNVRVKRSEDMPSYQMMDIKMETGTGKTYVYTKTMFELHKRCGFNKFIIAVPTLPIKAGTSSFLEDSTVMRHFTDTCKYNARIELCVLKAQKTKNKGKLKFPTAVGRFFYGSKHEKNKIYVLLLNSQLLTNGKLLTREDYDQMVGEFHRPTDAIKDTRPVLIIDEPHRMERESKSFVSLIKSFEPQLVLRYGATFPEHTFGKGKNKSSEKDHINLVYDLNACEAFRQTLIKGVSKEHLELPGGKSAEKKIKITKINNTEKSVNMQYTTNDGNSHYVLHAGDSLSQIDPDLSGISISGISAKNIELSNGQIKETGMEFFPDQYSTSYQEGMLSLALKRHFETERELFEHTPTRIKALALFFIDNIESYRGTENKNDGWLHNKFIELLKERLLFELSRKNDTEYQSYLQATLDNINDACAGYFSKDNQDSDENIAKEVSVILHGKKELISFKDKNGNWNIQRFLFSKWTLKEGWDNPNVFTICKLRSSGSEISKLQEVGRGLRLPVDEAGNRIVDKTFMLNYIVDFTEKDFATKLVEEINSDIMKKEIPPMELSISEIEKVAIMRGMTIKSLFMELIDKDYIGIDHKIILSNFDAFIVEYPEFNNINEKNGVDSSRIRNRNSERKGTIGIRKARFEEIRELWKKLNKKYVLYFEKGIEEELKKRLPEIIKEKNIFSHLSVSSDRRVVGIENDKAVSTEATGTQLLLNNRHMAYNEFLKRVSYFTCVPITILHEAICKAANNGTDISNEMFNENSSARLINAIDDWKAKNLAGMVKYKQANYHPKETRLTNADGSVKDEVAQAFIGRKRENKNVLLSPKYLYDTLAYDSDLERKNIMESDIDEIIVYGKIPSSSICIPTVASSNYSPDFMYVVKKKDGTKELNIVIETKGYDNESKIAEDEEIKISCAELFFNDISTEGYSVYFRKQINSKGIKDIIEELIKK